VCTVAIDHRLVGTVGNSLRTSRDLLSVQDAGYRTAAQVQSDLARVQNQTIVARQRTRIAVVVTSSRKRRSPVVRSPRRQAIAVLFQAPKAPRRRWRWVQCCVDVSDTCTASPPYSGGVTAPGLHHLATPVCPPRQAREASGTAPNTVDPQMPTNTCIAAISIVALTIGCETRVAPARPRQGLQPRGQPHIKPRCNHSTKASEGRGSNSCDHRHTQHSGHLFGLPSGRQFVQAGTDAGSSRWITLLV